MTRRWVVAAAAGLALLAWTADARAQASAGDEESELLVEEARAAVADGEYDRAAALLDRALKVNPRRIDAYILRASVHAVRKEFAQGVAVMRKAYALAPDNPSVLTALGTQFILAKDFGEGIPMLEKVAAQWPDRYEAHVVLGHVYVKLGQWEWAIEAFDRYFRARPSTLAKEDATHLVDHANAHLRHGNPQKARELYQKVLAGDPKNVLARLGVAWSAAAIDCESAMPVLDGISDLAAKYPSVLMVQGRCAILVGRGRDALAIALSYNQKQPDAADGWALLGEAKFATGDVKGALAAMGEAARREPDNKVYLFRLARLERLAGQPKAAADRLKAAGPPDGFEDDWTLELGESLLADERPAEVKEILSVWVQIKPDVAQARTILGLALIELDEPSAAIAELERAVALNPGDARARGPLIDALNTVAVEAYRRGDLAFAERQLVRADSLGKNALTSRNLGAVRIAMRRPDDAIAPLIEAIKGNDGVAQHLLGRAYRAQGKHDEAREALKRALALAGNDAARVADIRIDLAAAALAGNDPQVAVQVLEPALGGKDPAIQQRVLAAYLTAGRATATAWLRAGSFERAFRLLEELEKRLPKDSPLAVEIRCDLALAATGAGLRDVALARLRKLEAEKVVCPFVAPADELAVPILIAWNEGAELAKAERALARLEALRKKATGAARPLVRDAARYIALRAGAEAYAKGKIAKAKAFVLRASKVDPDVKSNELIVDLAVFQLDEGKIDAAIAELERVAHAVPEALVHLGIAHDKRNDPLKALEYYRKAASAGVRVSGLKRWISIKERLWGAQGDGR